MNQGQHQLVISADEPPRDWSMSIRICSTLCQFAVGLVLTVGFPLVGCRQQAEVAPQQIASEQSVVPDESQIEVASEDNEPAENSAPPDTVLSEPVRPRETVRTRLSDNRPQFDEARLHEAGIAVYRSQRLILLTDVSSEDVANLPLLADQLFMTLESRLGKLPRAADGSEFQVTGCLMDAPERFQSAGLMPELELVIRHGRHLDYRFWMFNPPADYYRRHLLLHEFVHCFMTCEFGMLDIPPLWYTEGIAEFFATHSLTDDSAESVRFGVLPDDPLRFQGWGRISEIRRSFLPDPSVEPADAGFTALQAVLYPPTNSFQQDAQYAHAWALYWLLQRHPYYQPFFEPMLQVRSRRQFAQIFESIPEPVWQRLAVDWLLILDSLTEGFDAERSFPMHVDQTVAAMQSETAELDATMLVHAVAGWQDSGERLMAGQTVTISASGRFQMAVDPAPWISEPQGVTIEYHRGRPLGELTAILVAEDGTKATQRIPVGVKASLQIPFDSRIWLQLNDSAASRKDNAGYVSVKIEVDR